MTGEGGARGLGRMWCEVRAKGGRARVGGCWCCRVGWAVVAGRPSRREEFACGDEAGQAMLIHFIFVCRFFIAKQFFVC